MWALEHHYLEEVKVKCLCIHLPFEESMEMPVLAWIFGLGRDGVLVNFDSLNWSRVFSRNLRAVFVLSLVKKKNKVFNFFFSP